jgi:peptidoglycan/xylan/chitin deacetylase (PgdA/CDA1 family)
LHMHVDGGSVHGCILHTRREPFQRRDSEMPENRQLATKQSRVSATVPILLYHSVSDSPSSYIKRFAVSPETFRRHLAAIAERGCTTLTVSEYVDAAATGPANVPDGTVVVTFDDGYEDFYEHALPALLDFGIKATIYVASGFLRDFDDGSAAAARGRMMDVTQLQHVADAGTEIGGHTHSHPELDTLRRADARDEIESCKVLLTEVVGREIRSFAYPHGYSSASVRRLVEAAGYDSACGVKNAISSPDDDRFSLSRLMIRDVTSLHDLEQWLGGAGAPIAPRREQIRTRGWRVVRRFRAATRQRRR